MEIILMSFDLNHPAEAALAEQALALALGKRGATPAPTPTPTPAPDDADCACKNCLIYDISRTFADGCC